MPNINPADDVGRVGRSLRKYANSKDLVHPVEVPRPSLELDVQVGAEQVGPRRAFSRNEDEVAIGRGESEASKKNGK